MRAPYIRTGYESIIPIRVSDKFVTTAKENGIVNKVTNNSITVTYETLGKKTYAIKNWTSKEESGACYTHVMITSLKENDTFIKDDTLIYDSAFFEPDIFNPRRVIYRQGDTITVALAEDPQTYEDSGAISKTMAGHLATTVTKVKSIVVSNTDNIIGMVNTGDKVEPSNVLFSITDSMLGNIKELDERTREILQNIKTSSPKAKLRGTIDKIVIYYNCEFEELSESLKELVKISDAKLIKDTGYNGKVNNSYSINGVPLAEGNVEIKIYIHVVDKMGIGDKAIFANQLKFTVGEVYDYTITGTEGTVVDAVFSHKSIAARVVNSPIMIGTTSMVLEQLAKKAVDLYFN